MSTATAEKTAATGEARRVVAVIRGIPTSDGAGVKLTRVIGQRALPDLDPFLMLDEFGSEKGADYIGGFPDHPHRGFETVTYMLDGRMRHGDNKGHSGLLVSGSVQWMTAGRGIVHSEMAGVKGPVGGVATDPTYLDIALEKGASFTHTLPKDYNAFAYVFEGAAMVGIKEVEHQQLAVLSLGERFEVRADEGPARLILVAGKPLREPVAKYGPFVMNTPEEIHQAIADFQAGKF